MIEKLKYTSVEDAKKKLEEGGAGIFSSLIVEPLAPTNDEIINKINEIIDYINGGE